MGTGTGILVLNNIPALEFLPEAEFLQELVHFNPTAYTYIHRSEQLHVQVGVYIIR